MAGTVKKLQFSEGTDVGAPTDLSLATSTTTISEYADDTAYTTANGAASAGDVYINSTLKVLRYYTGSAWRNAVPAMDPTDATKTFLIDISGNTTGVSATLSFSATGNRIYSFPDVAITVAGRANAETLSNKTLASPLISGGSIDTTGAGALAIGASVGANNMTLGGATSTVVVAGNLQVQGTTTTVNSTTMEVADANVLVNNGGNDASAEGAGLTVERTGTSGSFIYKDASASKFACGPQGTEVDIVTTSSTQTLTNKTIGVSQLSGQVSISNGGTGQSTSNAALNALLPTQTGNAGKVLQTDATNTSWVSVATSSLAQNNVNIGDSGNVQQATNTYLLGDIKGNTGSATVTISIASPGVVTYTSHGLSSGDKIYLTTTGALPTGLSASTTYYVYKIDANSFNLCTTLENVASATKINTSGSQSGTHTIFVGGIKYSPGTLSVGPTTTSLTANGTFTTIATLQVTTGIYVVYSGGYCASGGGTHYVAQARWIVKGSADTTDGKSNIYMTDDGTGERVSSQMTPYYLTVDEADATKSIGVQVAMTETGSPSRNWVQYIWAMKIQ